VATILIFSFYDAMQGLFNGQGLIPFRSIPKNGSEDLAMAIIRLFLIFLYINSEFRCPSLPFRAGAVKRGAAAAAIIGERD
jgi:hypothetical protein